MKERGKVMVKITLVDCCKGPRGGCVTRRGWFRYCSFQFQFTVSHRTVSVTLLLLPVLQYPFNSYHIHMYKYI